MTIRITKNVDGILISGDKEILEKLPEDFDASTIDISDVRIDAQALNIAYDRATYTGLDAIKRYAAIKQAFIEQQELAHIDANKPKEQYEPAITSQSIKAVDA